MRAYLFSDINKIADLSENFTTPSIWFCDMKRCECEVEIILPAVLHCFGGEGGGVVFLGDTGLGDTGLWDTGEIYLQNAVAIFGKSEICLYQKSESSTCLFASEFVSMAVHVVHGYRHFAVVSCGGVSLEIFGLNFQCCDCVNENGRDYIFLKFENHLCCVSFCGEGYEEVFNVPATDFEVSNGVCKVVFAPKISAGGVLFCEIPLSGEVQSTENFKFTKFKLENPKNFNFYTFENYFFELLFFARMLEKSKAEKLISKYLSTELRPEIGGILDFLGDFCGIVPQPNGGVILVYQKAENCFETRMFETEVLHTKEGLPVVENISESEIFKFQKGSFQDFSKIMLNF